MDVGTGFATTTHSDHRPWIWVASILSLIYSLLCLAARFTGKWDLLWWDDAILSAGYLSALVHYALLFAGISHGVGVSSIALSREGMDMAAKLYFASRVPYFLAHCLAKASILVFTRRIFAGDIYKENIYFGLAYGMTAVYGLLAILLSSAGCRPEDALTASTNAVCDANAARWAALTALDGLTEVIILVMPVWFISKNQLKASKKRIVIFVYMFRLIVIVFSIVTTASYFNFLNKGRDNIDISPVVAWQEVLLSFSLISASFPCLRSFLWAFMSRGLATMYGTTTFSNSESHSRNASVHLRSMNHNRSQLLASQTGSDANMRIRPERGLEYKVDVRGEGLRSKKPATNTDRDDYATKRSDDSDRMIIHHETTYHVESS